MTDVLLVLLKLGVVLSIFAVGMGSTFSDMKYLWTRPALLARSLVAMYVLVPLAALLLVQWLPVGTAGKAAMLVLAVSAGAPLLPKKLGPLSSDQYVFSLVVTSSLLAIVLVPAWVAMLGRHFGTSVELTPGVIAMALAKVFLVPLLLGMGLQQWLPGWSGKASDRLIAAGGALLAVPALLLLAIHWQVLAAVGWGSLVSLLLMLAVALLIGHGLGGPSADNRTSLAIACATRHIGIAMLVATSFPGPNTAVMIATYVLASMLVTVPYLRWRGKHAAVPVSG